MNAYCIKCKSKTEVKNATEKVTKKGTKCFTGNCSKCDKRVLVFLKKNYYFL